MSAFIHAKSSCILEEEEEEAAAKSHNIVAAVSHTDHADPIRVAVVCEKDASGTPGEKKQNQKQTSALLYFSFQ